MEIRGVSVPAGAAINISSVRGEYAPKRHAETTLRVIELHDLDCLTAWVEAGYP